MSHFMFVYMHLDFSGKKLIEKGGMMMSSGRDVGMRQTFTLKVDLVHARCVRVFLADFLFALFLYISNQG